MQERAETNAREQHHTLLNHIAVVSTYGHLLSDTELDEDQAEIVSEMIGAATRALDVANELGSALAPCEQIHVEQRAS